MKCYELRETKGIDSLVLAERDQPVPGPDRVLVRIRAASLNFRDLAIVNGRYPAVKLPLIPFSDGCGEVIEIGVGVTRVKPGDRVAAIFMQDWIGGEGSAVYSRSALGGAIDGMLAEYAVFHENGLVHIPQGLSFEEGATLPCAAVTAWNALVNSALRPGASVLVLGTGGVSVFALQFAKLAGARVVVTSSSGEKLRKARELGASDGVNYKVHPDWDRKVLDLTGGYGVDHVIEVGGAGTLARSMNAVRAGGRISLIGVLAGVTAEVNPMPILGKQIQIHGIFVGSREMFEAMNRAIALHELRPVVHHVFGFDKVRDAFRMLESGGHFGKIVVRVSS